MLLREKELWAQIHVLPVGTDQVFRLNWAANGRQGVASPSDYSLFVGDLTEEVTDYMLQEAFRRFYPSVRSAKVSLKAENATAVPSSILTPCSYALWLPYVPFSCRVTSTEFSTSDP